LSEIRPFRRPLGRRALRFALVGDFLVLSLLLAGLSSLRERASAPLPLPAPVDIGAVNQRRLDSVNLQVNALAGASESRVGVALISSDQGLVLGRQPDSPFVLASVAKVYILSAYLDQLAREERKITESDMELAQAMIEFSDNHSASVLWKRIGGAAGLAAFLQSHGMEPLWPAGEENEWGTLEASPRQVATLLWELTLGRLLDPESTQIVFALLSHVTEDQRWGVSAGVTARGSSVYVKNGWYPEEDGWRLNSAGVVKTPATDYVLVVLSDTVESMDSGINVIEQVAGLINDYMAGKR
jgi:beta-lactamase class A